MYPDDTLEDMGFTSLLILGFVVLVSVLALAIFGE
jgi:hypothetical protein